MASLDDLNSTFQNGVRNLGQIAQTLSNAFPQVFGSFTLSAATTTNVAQPKIVAAGFPLLTPVGATAGATILAHGLYVSAVTAGVGFAVSTNTGTPLGTETISYVVFNPV